MWYYELNKFILIISVCFFVAYIFWFKIIGLVLNDKIVELKEENELADKEIKQLKEQIKQLNLMKQ